MNTKGTDNQEKSCYEFILHENQNNLSPLWTKNQVEATYVIYLEGNKDRYEQVIEQLKIVQPTETVWILHNKGYKYCAKPNVQNPPEDLVDANITIFKHANDQDYKNILVLEDDFLFDERLLQNKDEDLEGPRPNQEVGEFVENWNKVTPFISLVYYLGTLPLIQCPIGWSHNATFATCGTHSVIYNRKMRDNTLLTPRNQMKDWDIYINLRYMGTRYTYRVPLCYQLFPNTENSDYWGYQDPILFWISKIFRELIYLFQLDKKIEPGYSLYNLISKILFFFIFFLVVYVLWIVMYWIISFFIPVKSIMNSKIYGKKK